MFDMILRGGRLMEPLAGAEGTRDIAVGDGRILAVEQKIDAGAKTEIDVQGQYVCPGLIDFHTHAYWGTPWGIDADKVGPQTGVTTFVDFGTTGPGNFTAFLEHVIRRAQVRIYAFLHIAYNGLLGAVYDPRSSTMIGELEDFRLISHSAAIDMAKEHPEVIRGIKVRASLDAAGSNARQTLETAKDAAVFLGLPLAVHIGQPPVTAKEALSILDSQDILTHSLRGPKNSILDRDGVVIPEACRARERGVLFDVGVGKGSCSFVVARKLIAQGFLPDIISTDLHAYCIDGMKHDLPTTMSKFMALGMTLRDVIAATTIAPARAMDLSDAIGSITVGHYADICVFRVDQTDADCRDANGDGLHLENRIVPTMTIKGGEILWPRPEG